MKKPSLKRKPSRKSKKQPTPQAQGPAAGPARGRPLGDLPRRILGLLGGLLRMLRWPLRLLGRPLRRLGGPLGRLRGPLVKLTKLRGRARIVVYGVLALLVVILALQLGGGRDDDKLVRAALARYEKASRDKDYQMLCDELFASSYVRQTAGSGLPCEVALRTALQDVRNPTLQVLSVEVNGDRALARVRGSAAGQVPGEDNYTLVRENGAWRILPPRPRSSSAAP
ncbi:MAG: hypothetical protein QOJ63_311 [Solirubrobacteraceae bacterium]|jgi:hypothetical protein|nr:hypothetical protein [Solirubrobacteraceae bacterium]